MGELNENKLNITKIFSRTALVLMLGFFALYFLFGYTHLPSERVITSDNCSDYNKGWIWHKPDGTREEIELARKYDVGSEDKMVITTTLPTDIYGQSFVIWNKGQDAKIYVDGGLRKTYTTKETSWFGKENPYDYIFIDFNLGDSGKELKIEYLRTSDALGDLGNAYIGEKTSIFIRLIKPYQFQIIMAGFLAFISAGCIVLDLIINFRYKRITGIMYLGLGVIIVSLWVVMSVRARQFVFSNVSLIRDCAYMAVPLGLYPTLIFMDEVQKHRYHKSYLILEFLDFSVFISYIFTYIITGKVYFTKVIIIFLLAILRIGIAIFQDIINKHIKEYKYIAIGCVALLVTVSAQFLSYIIKPTGMDEGFVMTLGLIILVIMAIIDSVNSLFAMNDDKIKAERTAENLQVQAMETLSRVVDAKDKYTSGHSERVAKYSCMIAKKLGWDEKEVKSMHYIALLHDVGKIGVPDTIINKPGKLTDEEYDIIKSHPSVGAEILAIIEEMPDIAVGAHWHHERYDGKGYPDGLAGTEIPEIARIITVADSYDAMTSNRSYRKYLPQNVVREEIEKNIGIQFDPEFARLMIEIIDEDKEYILHE